MVYVCLSCFYKVALYFPSICLSSDCIIMMWFYSYHVAVIFIIIVRYIYICLCTYIYIVVMMREFSKNKVLNIVSVELRQLELHLLLFSVTLCFTYPNDDDAPQTSELMNTEPNRPLHLSEDHHCHWFM